MTELSERAERARVLLHQAATDIIGAFNATDDLLGALPDDDPVMDLAREALARLQLPLTDGVHEVIGVLVGWPDQAGAPGSPRAGDIGESLAAARAIAAAMLEEARPSMSATQGMAVEAALARWDRAAGALSGAAEALAAVAGPGGGGVR